MKKIIFGFNVYFQVFNYQKPWKLANEIDDWLEDILDYAFDEKRGYLTSCPTNVGTGLRASVMMHLPGLVLTQQMNRIIPAINQIRSCGKRYLWGRQRSTWVIFFKFPTKLP